MNRLASILLWALLPILLAALPASAGSAFT
jgi:hypothetical protein